MHLELHAFGLTFTDVFEIHEKIDVNIAGDVWKKRGVRRFENEYEQGRANFLMIFFLLMTAITFSLFGFVIGLWADNFEKLSLIPLIVITPLVFLGGSFYSISMLPIFWQKISMFNPVVYLISGFR